MFFGNHLPRSVPIAGEWFHARLGSVPRRVITLARAHFQPDDEGAVLSPFAWFRPPFGSKDCPPVTAD